MKQKSEKEFSIPIVSRVIKTRFFSEIKGLLIFLGLYVITLFINRYIFNVENSSLNVIKITFQNLIDFEVLIISELFSIFSLSKETIENTIYFQNNDYITVLPGCSGLYQMMQITFIMIFYPGPWKKKIWYIPLSIVFILLAALLHLILLCIVVIIKPEMFHFTHTHVYRWLFYGCFFLIWLVWQEKICKKKNS